MMWWYGPGMSGWGVALMAVGMIVFWTLVVLGLIALARYLLTSGGRTTETRRTAEELLAERFAGGEIDEQDYHRRLDVLHGRSKPLMKP
jgi:putative membrane protein